MGVSVQIWRVFSWQKKIKTKQLMCPVCHLAYDEVPLWQRSTTSLHNSHECDDKKVMIGCWTRSFFVDCIETDSVNTDFQHHVSYRLTSLRQINSIDWLENTTSWQHKKPLNNPFQNVFMKKVRTAKHLPNCNFASFFKTFFFSSLHTCISFRLSSL